MQYLTKALPFRLMDAESQHVAMKYALSRWGIEMADNARTRTGCTFQPPLWCAYALTTATSDDGALTLHMESVVDIPDLDMRAFAKLR